MSDIKSWSASAAGNNAASPNGFPEGMAPSGLNDAARETMAAVRRWYDDAQWLDLGDAPTQTGATTFTLAGDKTAVYAVGRRLKLDDSSMLYGTITNSSYSNPNTTVAVALDSGSLTGALSAVAVGILTPGNTSVPTISVANGGTGATSAPAALANLGAMANALTTRGDLVVEDATPAPARLAIGGAGTHLISDGTDPGWGLFLRSYLAGLTLSNNAGTPASKIDVAAGVAADSSNARLMRNNGTVVLDCGTTGANGLDSGSLANNTWYHVFLIMQADGTVAALASTSPASPSLPGGYAYKRRIGAFRTDGSANIIAFTQIGDEFLWKMPVAEFEDTNPGTAAVFKTLTVPTGIKITALASFILKNNSGTPTTALITSPDQADTAPAVTPDLGDLRVISLNGTGSTTYKPTRTNSSAQIRYRLSASNANAVLSCTGYGWIDRRGRDD